MIQSHISYRACTSPKLLSESKLISMVSVGLYPLRFELYKFKRVRDLYSRLLQYMRSSTSLFSFFNKPRSRSTTFSPRAPFYRTIPLRRSIPSRFYGLATRGVKGVDLRRTARTLHGGGVSGGGRSLSHEEAANPRCNGRSERHQRGGQACRRI